MGNVEAELQPVEVVESVPMMIREPPAPPVASTGRPATVAIVGLMDERGRLPPCAWFAVLPRRSCRLGPEISSAA